MPTEEKTVQQSEILTAEDKEVLAAPPIQEPPAATEASTQDISRKHQELEARDRSILDALDQMLARQAPPQKKPQPEESSLEKFCIGMVRKGAGVISLSLVLIIMGIAVICCFFSPAPDYLILLKLSPIAAVLIGLELLVYQLASRSKFRINIFALAISALIIAGCCTMAVLLNGSYTESTEAYNNRSIAAEIYERGYHELRHAADIEEISVQVELNPDGTANISGIDALSADDIVNITVTFCGNYADPKEFASECKTIIDGYRFLGIPVTSFCFISETKLSSFRLDVNGLFMQDYSEAELAEKVHHIYIENVDSLKDLEDNELETQETRETTEARR